MPALLPLARAFSRPPLSDFYVGAVVLGRSGRLYLGANIEIPGHSLGLTVHAEQAALANAYMAGEMGIAAIAVTAAPCGHCRQFLNEMSPDGDIRVLLPNSPVVTLAALLPQAFGPKDLGLTQGALPVREVGLELVQRPSHALVRAALASARRSWAPYTSAHSGVAIRAGSQTFTGSYIENAAFNPSLSPLHTALAGFFAAGRDPKSIRRVVLVEVRGAKISQANSVRAALAALAPAAQLTLVKVRKLDAGQ